MPEYLFERLDELRGRVRYVLWVHGLCWLVVVFFLSGTLAGGLDWLLHLDDSGVRFLLTLGILGGTGWVLWRYLWIPLATRLTDVELAARIERHNPQFADRISSTVAFLQSGEDQRVGSPELQREVIRQTLNQLNSIRVEGIVETKPVQRIAWTAFATCLVVALLVGFNRAEASTAINRLAFPFSRIPWPRDVELRFVTQELQPLLEKDGSSLTAVQGETLQLFVENTRGPIPADLTLIQRKADGRLVKEPMRPTKLWNDADEGREVGGASLVVTSGPLFFWARGGDGETLPVQIEVVPPPRLTTMSVTVTPPAYTGLKPQTLPDRVGNLQGYLGTTVRVVARSNKALQSAALYRKDVKPVAADLSGDGHRLTAEFTIEDAGTYSWWLTLKDRQGFGNPEAPRFEIRGIPDAPPDVHFKEPKGDALVTATAQVPFQIDARDDLALKTTRLVYESAVPEQLAPASRPAPVETLIDEDTGAAIGDPEPARGPRNDLDDSPDSAGSELREVQAEPGRGEFELYNGDDRPEQLTLDFEWKLGPHQFPVGTRVVVHAEATDWFDLGPDHVGRSNPRTLTIVSLAEKKDELAQRQSALVLDLERTSALQRASRGFLDELRVQIEKTGTLRTEDLDLLKRVELDHRQLESRLTDEHDGLAERAQSLQRERVANRIEDPVSSEILETLAGELQFLRDGPLPEIRQRLTRSLKQAASASEDEPLDKSARDDLDKTARQQELVQQTLDKLLGQMSSWRQERNLSGDLRSVTAEQEKIAKESAEAGQRTQGKSFAELSPQEQADLSRLSQRQQQIARDVGDFKSQLQSTADDLRDHDPDSAAQLGEALKNFDEAGIDGLMRQAAGNLNRNRIGEARRQQDEAIEELQKIRDVLEDREVTNTENLVKRLGEEEQRLNGLRGQLQDVMQKLDAANQLQNPQEREGALEELRKEAQQLKQELKEQLRRLRRLQSPSADAAQRAAEQLENVDQALKQNEGGPAQQHLQEALDDLEQAQRELARDRKKAEESLAQEELEKLADNIQRLLERQVASIAESKRLHGEFEARGRWSRVLLKSLKNLATAQRNLESEVRSAAESMKVVEVVGLALGGAGDLMANAARRLDKRDVGEGTVRVQELARKRLADLAEALQAIQDEKQQQQNEDAEGPDEGGNNEDEPQDAAPPAELITLITQLQVMRSLQAGLLERVEGIEASRRENGDLTDEQTAELEQIANEQSKLADLARELTSFFGDPEDEPAAPPDDPTVTDPDGVLQPED